MLAESQRLENKLQSLSKQLEQYPEGKIYCTQSGNHYKWYKSDGHNQTYIPKKDRHYAEQLAAKKYLSSLYQDCLREKKAIDFYLRHHNTNPSKAESMLSSPGYQELLAPYFKPLSQELDDWMHDSYEQNPNYPEQLTIKTISGNTVRSKSEALIDMILYTHKIPYRYECALLLGDTIAYPDFTIRHPHTGKTYYYEHFGMMDDSRYAKNAYTKLQFYHSYNIIPTIQLITTFETKSYPLTPETIENIIKQYFL